MPANDVLSALSPPHPTALSSNGHPAADNGLLRLITCGSVDDGKSTLIGRLLYDTRSIHQDQLEAVRRTSIARGSERVDLSLLTDGLRAEREQGITIDVAYRSFATPTRKFILADTPGHFQYTRNMATAASSADAAVILVDARLGIIEQTRRHACLAALLGIRDLLVCINKMDLVDFAQARFDELRIDFAAFTRVADPDGAGPLFDRIQPSFFPISALDGDNVVTRSQRTPWYPGPSLLEYLERIPGRVALEGQAARLPIQYVIRPQAAAHHDYRGYAGQLATGTLCVGDEVIALPQDRRSKITRIHIGERDVLRARAPESIAVELEDDLDISRGSLLVHAEPSTSLHPVVTRDLEATIIWMSTAPLTPGRRLIAKHGCALTPAVVRTISSRLDVHTLTSSPDAPRLGLNEVGRATLKFASPIACEPYRTCRATGAFILIDEHTNDTVGAGLIERAIVP